MTATQGDALIFLLQVIAKTLCLVLALGTVWFIVYAKNNRRLWVVLFAIASCGAANAAEPYGTYQHNSVCREARVEEWGNNQGFGTSNPKYVWYRVSWQDVGGGNAGSNWFVAERGDDRETYKVGGNGVFTSSANLTAEQPKALCAALSAAAEANGERGWALAILCQSHMGGSGADNGSSLGANAGLTCSQCSANDPACGGDPVFVEITGAGEVCTDGTDTWAVAVTGGATTADVTGVAWTWGDGQTDPTGSVVQGHSYSGLSVGGTVTIVADVTLEGGAVVSSSKIVDVVDCVDPVSPVAPQCVELAGVTKLVAKQVIRRGFGSLSHRYFVFSVAFDGVNENGVVVVSDVWRHFRFDRAEGLDEPIPGGGFVGQDGEPTRNEWCLGDDCDAFDESCVERLECLAQQADWSSSAANGDYYRNVLGCVCQGDWTYWWNSIRAPASPNRSLSLFRGCDCPCHGNGGQLPADPDANCHEDGDGDGFGNCDDPCPASAANDCSACQGSGGDDVDGDGTKNCLDRDDDDDGCPDGSDPDPTDANVSCTYDPAECEGQDGLDADELAEQFPQCDYDDDGCRNEIDPDPLDGSVGCTSDDDDWYNPTSPCGAAIGEWLARFHEALQPFGYELTTVGVAATENDHVTTIDFDFPGGSEVDYSHDIDVGLTDDASVTWFKGVVRGAFSVILYVYSVFSFLGVLGWK